MAAKYFTLVVLFLVCSLAAFSQDGTGNTITDAACNCQIVIDAVPATNSAVLAGNQAWLDSITSGAGLEGLSGDVVGNSLSDSGGADSGGGAGAGVSWGLGGAGLLFARGGGDPIMPGASRQTMNGATIGAGAGLATTGVAAAATSSLAGQSIIFARMGWYALGSYARSGMAAIGAWWAGRNVAEKILDDPSELQAATQASFRLVFQTTINNAQNVAGVAARTYAVAVRELLDDYAGAAQEELRWKDILNNPSTNSAARAFAQTQLNTAQATIGKYGPALKEWVLDEGWKAGWRP